MSPALSRLIAAVESASNNLMLHAKANPECLTEDAEYRLLIARRDLEDAARVGGTIDSYIEATASVLERV